MKSWQNCFEPTGTPKMRRPVVTSTGVVLPSRSVVVEYFCIASLSSFPIFLSSFIFWGRIDLPVVVVNIRVLSVFITAPSGVAILLNNSSKKSTSS